MLENEMVPKAQVMNVIQPEPQPSAEGHIQAYGGEMLTWAREGAVTGLAIGAVAGVGAYLFIMADFVLIPAFDILRVNAPVLFGMIIILLSAGVGAAAGTVVGIGTPRFNPHPSQGWVRSWKTFILRRKNHDKYIYVPEFKPIKETSHISRED